MPIALIILGLILVVLNYIALNKEGNNSFVDILKSKEMNVTDEKIEIVKVRKEMAETITELQREIYELRKELDNYKEIEGKVEGKTYEKYSEEISEKKYLLGGEDGVVSNINFNHKERKSNKIDKIVELINSGFNDDDICIKLSVGKGEVLLVRNLYKN